jgi:hypothetical protein
MRVLACWTAISGTQRVFLVDYEDGSYGWLCQYFERWWLESKAYDCRSRFDNEDSARQDVLRNIPWACEANEDRVMDNLVVVNECEDALLQGDHSRLDAWLLAGGSPFTKLSTGERLFDKVVGLGWTSTARFILEKGINPCSGDWISLSPLQIAASHGYCDLIELLADYGADVNEEGWNSDDLPIQLALGEGHTAAVETLVRRGARLPDNALTIAIHSDNPDAIALVIEYGADVNKLDQGEPPLFTAAEDGNVEIAKLLLAHGAKVNPNTGRLPILAAINQKDRDMAVFLVEHGAVIPDYLREQWVELSQGE